MGRNATRPFHGCAGVNSSLRLPLSASGADDKYFERDATLESHYERRARPLLVVGSIRALQLIHSLGWLAVETVCSVHALNFVKGYDKFGKIEERLNLSL